MQRATAPTELLALSAEDFHDLLVRYLGREGDLERLTSLELATHQRLDQIVGG